MLVNNSQLSPFEPAFKVDVALNTQVGSMIRWRVAQVLDLKDHKITAIPKEATALYRRGHQSRVTTSLQLRSSCRFWALSRMSLLGAQPRLSVAANVRR